jgi:hypothetical protein
MKLPSYFGRTALALCAAFVILTVTPTVVSAASFPTLGTRLYYMLGSFVTGGMVHRGTAATNTTSLAGRWQVLPEFSNSTTLRPITGVITSGFPYRGEFTAYVVGTGSTTIKYNAVCVPLPLGKIGAGSGLVLRLDYHAFHNPAGAGGDIGIVDNCNKTTSGSNLIDNVCTSTGCISSYTTGTAQAGSGKFLKFTPNKDLTTSYTGRITFELLNIWGE